jgi:hypothetical protein
MVETREVQGEQVQVGMKLRWNTCAMARATSKAQTSRQQQLHSTAMRGHTAYGLPPATRTDVLSCVHTRCAKHARSAQQNVPHGGRCAR